MTGNVIFTAFVRRQNELGLLIYFSHGALKNFVWKDQEVREKVLKEEKNISELCDVIFFWQPFPLHSIWWPVGINEMETWWDSWFPPSENSEPHPCAWPWSRGASCHGTCTWSLGTTLASGPGNWVWFPDLLQVSEVIFSSALQMVKRGNERQTKPVYIPLLEFTPLRQIHQNCLRESEGKCIKDYEVLRCDHEGNE